MSAANEHNLKAFSSVKVPSPTPVIKGFTSISISLLFIGLYKFGSCCAAFAMGVWQHDKCSVFLISWLHLGMG